MTVKTTDLSAPSGRSKIVSYVVVSPELAVEHTGAGAGGGEGAGGRVIVTVSGTWSVAWTSAADDVTTLFPNPDAAAAVLTAAMMACACATPAAGSLAKVERASVTLAQSLPHVMVYEMESVEPVWRRRCPSAPTIATSTL